MDNLCIFCYKSIPINSTVSESIEVEVGKNSGSVFKSFIKLVGRYLGNPGESNGGDNKWLNCCADCQIIIGSFCHLYQELKLLEIQLEWKLNTLMNVMKLANRVPSRVKQLKCLFEQGADGQQKLKSFKGFRSNLIKKCARKLAKSRPRVFLGRRDDDCDTPAKSTRNSENKTDSDNKLLSPFLENFLGRIMSFSAVALLATTANNQTAISTTLPTFRNQDNLFSEGIPVEIGLDEGQTEKALMEAESTENKEGVYNEDKLVGPGEELEIHSEDTGLTAVLPKVEQGIENDEKFFTSHGPISDGDPFEDCENDFQEDDIISNHNHKTLSTDEQHVEAVTNPETEQKFLAQQGSQPEIKSESTEIRLEPMQRNLRFICKICSKGYKYKRTLEKHVKKYHSTVDTVCTPVISIDKNKYFCKMCNFICKSYGALLVHKTTTNHQMKHHFTKRDTISGIKETEAQNENLVVANTSTTNLMTMNQEENQLQGPALRYNLREKRKRSYSQAEMYEETKSEENDHAGISDREFSNEDDSSSSSDSDTSIQCKKEAKKDQVKKKINYRRENRYTIKTNTKELREQHRKLAAHSNYKCDVKDCNASFKTRLLLIYHKDKEHKIVSTTTGTGNTMRCEICNLRILKFRQEIHFSEYHDTKLHVDKILRCETENCSAYFKTNSQRFMHMSKEHTVPVKNVETLENHNGKFKCKFCDVVQENASDLAIHELEHAIREVSSAKISKLHKFNCARCPYGSIVKMRYVTHHLKKHLKVSPPSVTSKICHICGAEGKDGNRFYKTHFQSQHNTEGMDPNEIQRCDLCQAYFIKSEQLIMHKYLVHYKRKCPVCGKIFARMPHKLRFHMDQQHPLFNAFPHLRYTCDIKSCTKRFGTERELSHHKTHERHYDNKMMKCSKCGKEFKGEERLKAHVKSHANETHICSECGKTFNTKPKLDKHLLYHMGPDSWKFQCSTCGKKCFDRHKLTEHQRTHSKEKPFVCQLCGEKYAHRHNWLGHMRTKHKEEFTEVNVSSMKSANYISRKGFKKGEFIISRVNQG